jgi:anti-sigma factor RsiW
MSCPPFNLNDYLLEELPEPERRQMETHVKSCSPCQEELARLRIVSVALRSVPEEEIPQRIAFVSDKIFEPSPWRRWLAAFWNSGARLGFASAAMLSASLVAFSLRPAPAPIAVVRPAIPAPASQMQTAVVKPVSEEEIEQRIQVAVDKAIDAKTSTLVSELKEAQRTLKVVSDRYQMSQDRLTVQRASNYGLPAEARQ